MRVASAGPGGTFHIEVNGVDTTGPLVVPDTGGWQTWTTIRRAGVSLGAGQQVWRLVMDTNGATTAVGFSPPGQMPLGVTIGAATLDDRLHLTLRYRHATLNRAHPLDPIALASAVAELGRRGRRSAS